MSEDKNDIKMISRQQLYKDLRSLEEMFGAVYDISERGGDSGREVIYKYADEDFSIQRSPYNKESESLLRDSFIALSMFQGRHGFEFLNDFLPKLEKYHNVTLENNPIIYYDDKEGVKGLEYFPILTHMIREKAVLNISYKGFKKEKVTITIHPYILRQFNSRWYLYGGVDNLYSKEFEIWSIPLDRMMQIKRSKEVDFKQKIVNWVDFFHDYYGVTKEKDEKEEIVLHFYDKTGHYIATKPIHSSQKRGKWLDDNTFEVKLKLIPNYELESLILSYGENVEVIEPEVLRQKLSERIQKIRY
jgi:predicted DNA-binding transcriptional regulator YafY